MAGSLQAHASLAVRLRRQEKSERDVAVGYRNQLSNPHGLEAPFSRVSGVRS